MIRRPPRSTPKPSSAASDVYKRQDELSDIVEADPDLYYRSNVEAHYTNIDWDEMSDMYDHDHLDGMSDDDKKKYLLKNADQENLNNVYGFDERPDIEFLDFVVFSRKLVNS